MKIKYKIKNWYRGKAIPIRLIIAGQIIETSQNRYIKSPLAKLFTAIGKTSVLIFNFCLREWKWIITTAIALTVLLIALFAKK